MGSAFSSGGFEVFFVRVGVVRVGSTGGSFLADGGVVRVGRSGGCWDLGTRGGRLGTSGVGVGRAGKVGDPESAF